MSIQPTVLIIEDDPVFRRVLQFTAANAGLHVETASDGKAGYDRLIQAGIDFIVTDYQMPGYDGLEMLRRLDQLADYNRPATILCTAKGLELESEQLCQDFGLAGIMHKPFSPRKLGELIVGHLVREGRMESAQTSDDKSVMHAESSIRSPTRKGIGQRRVSRQPGVSVYRSLLGSARRGD